MPNGAAQTVGRAAIFKTSPRRSATMRKKVFTVASSESALPPRGKARQRWLTRSEVARLLWTCWRNREVQEGKPTDKRPLRHLVRVLLIGVYTGSRPGAILNAAWRQGPGLSFVDTVNGVFHRHAEGDVESTKRQPTVKLSPRLLAHLRRWERLDAGHARPQTYLVSYHGSEEGAERQNRAPHRLQARWRRTHQRLRRPSYSGIMARCSRTPDSEGRRLHRHGRADDLEPLRPPGARLSRRSGARDRPKGKRPTVSPPDKANGSRTNHHGIAGKPLISQ